MMAPAMELRRESTTAMAVGQGPSAGANSKPRPEAMNPPKSPLTSTVPSDFLLPDGYPDYLRLILTSKVYEVLQETPLTRATNLSNRYDCNVLIKREDMTPVHSFKLRGAYNKMANLPASERWRGVVACSAGNHAQGVAYSARKLKIPATIVMPTGTPAIKHKNVSRLGGAVVLFGDDYDAATLEAKRLEKVHDLTNIHPFDDPYIIAGQGTVGMEILRQTELENLEAIFVCVGGGGLISGIAVYVKRIAPHIKVIGVEASDAAAMHHSIRAGKAVVLSEVGLFADGAAVKSPGVETLRICQECVDEVMLVSTDEICAAIKDTFEDTRSILEPAGALGLAGLKKYAAERRPSNLHPSKRTLCAVASGANMNFDRLRFVADRAAIGEQREALLLCQIPETPGSFAKLVSLLPEPTIAITEFSYRYSNGHHADILMAISVSPSERARTLRTFTVGLAKHGMTCEDISSNELAKTHLRFMVGGQTRITGERLLSFEFPERPGALKRFLDRMRPGFNISLFHYRNVGGDVARILCGLQMPDDVDPVSPTSEQAVPHVQTNGSSASETPLSHALGNGVSGVQTSGVATPSSGDEEQWDVLKEVKRDREPREECEGSTFPLRRSASRKALAAMAELGAFLKDLGYPWRDETDDLVYRRFMRDEQGI